MRIVVFLFCLLLPGVLWAQVTLSGNIYDRSDGESLPGATVYVPDEETGTATNTFGFYSLTLPKGTFQLRFSYLGFESLDTLIVLEENTSLDVFLTENVGELEEIEVIADPFELKEQVNSTRMGTIRLQPREIMVIPTLGGESDLLKVLQLLPGVTSGSEGTNGMFVRGGTDDQNMVMLDDAVVYNLNHLFGFFSVFNSDAIRNVELVKGGFPAEMGGRLSSVMDVRMKEGSFQRYNVRGGIGLLTSRLTIDGPVIKDKMSFMVSARRTYIDRLFSLLGANLPYFFYDYNVKLNYKVSDRDRIYVSSYFGDDVLAFDETTEEETTGSEDLNFGFQLGNFTSTIRWNHIYKNPKLFSNITLHQTRFKYDIGGQFVDNNILIRSQIQDVGIKADWQYFKSPDNSFTFGMQHTLHLFRPNVVSTSGLISDLLESDPGNQIRNIEGAFYAGNERDLNDRIRLSGGLRMSFSIVDQVVYAGPEPRFSARYKLNEDRSLKFSYSLMRQYMHRVSSSSIALPTDLWYPVTRRVRPQHSHQFAAGYNHIFPNKGISFSAEIFYKSMRNLIEYREGASLILNNNFENELLAGNGDAYGVEFLVRKKTGVVTGWASYSYSDSGRQFDELNDGVRFNARFNRQHVANVVAMTRLNDRVSFSAVWTFQSGAWFTPQTGQYLMPNASLTAVELVPIYGARNSTELGGMHRLDLNFILKPRGDRRFGGEWHLGAYNFYNRASPFQVAIVNNGVNYEYVQRGLFGFIPSIGYNFNFSSK